MSFGEQQFFGKKEAPKEVPWKEEVELPKPEKITQETPPKNPEEIQQELQEKGVERENIEAALALMKRMGFLDRKIFPENPAAFNFALKENSSGDFAGFIRPEKDGKERSYQICVKDLAECFKEEKSKKVPIFGPERQLKLKKYQNEGQFLISIAAHEVRHRIQHDNFIRKFSPEDTKLVQDPLLRNIIKFYGIEFKEREKIYLKEGKSEEFIKEKLGPKEFDAMVIEKFVANKMHEKIKKLKTKLEPEDYEEIVSMIQIAAPEKED